MKFKKITAALICASILLTGCSGKRGRTYEDTLFDTVVKVKILDKSDESVIKGCENICKKYNRLFSPDNKNSDVYKINHAKGKAVTVSDDTIAIIKKGLYYGKFSKGEFDITIGSVSNLWDFRSGKKKVPASHKISRQLNHVNYHGVLIHGNSVTLTDRHAKLDLGGIARGYVADRLKAYLRKEGVKHATIDLGGTIQTVGTKPDGSDFNIGIQKPFGKTGDVIASVKIADQSVVTSGIYESCFKKNNKLYHQVLSTSTGRPCKTDLYSVSIITDSSLTADALSTICLMYGYERAENVINQLDNVDAIFITNDGEIHYTNNFLKNNQ